MQTGEEKQEPKMAESAIDFKEVFTLPSGKKAQVIQAKGWHLRQAQKMAGTDQSMTIFCLASLIIRIEGKSFVPEDLDEMDLKDAAAIQAKLGEYIA